MDIASVIHDSDWPLLEDATFKLVFEAAPHGMIMADSQGKIVLVNAHAESLFGYCREEMVGQSIEMLVPTRFQAKHLEYRHGFAQEPKIRPMGANRELSGRRKDSSEVPVEIGLTPITTEAGSYVLASIVDITERRRVGELALARDKALQESELKSKFVANMSHELRTPLASILGMNELLLASTLTQEQHWLAQAVQESGNALLRMVNDILDLSKIVAGKVELELTSADVRDIVEEVMRLFRTEASNQQLVFVSHVDPRVPHHLAGDPGRIKQVLVNLVGNSLKFTDSGEICVEITIEDEDTKHILLKFSVTDTGIGLSPSEQERIFKPFTQADESSTRKHGGVGLGLAISKQLVELMGGNIGVVSARGEGALFWFSIPFNISAQGEQTSISDTNVILQFPEAHVLVVEDDCLLQEMAMRQLAKLEVSAKAVATGQEALDELQQGNYDLVLMDCHLPFMDGYEATRMIREREGNSKNHLAIIAMTAAAMSGDFERCIQAGMDDYLSKPYTFRQLQNMLKKWLHVAPKEQLRTEIPQDLDVAQFSDKAPAICSNGPVIRFEELAQDWSYAELCEFLPLCRIHMHALLLGMTKAYATKNSERLAELAHKLRGTSAMIQATLLTDCCKQLYQAAQHKHWDATGEQLEKLQKLVSDTVEAIDIFLGNVRDQSNCLAQRSHGS